MAECSVYRRSYLGATVALLGVVLTFTVSCICLIILFPLRLLSVPRKWENSVIWGCAPSILKFMNSRVEVINREIYNPDEPCIVIANHSSLLDIPAIYIATSGSLRMLSKFEMYLIPLIGWGMFFSHFIGVRRGSRKSGEHAQQLIGKRLKQGYQIYIAPEGTRSADGKLLPFKSGAFRLAKMHEVPIIVLALEKPWEILPRTRLFPLYGGTIKATFLGRLENRQNHGKTDKFPSADERLREARELYLKHGFVES